MKKRGFTLIELLAVIVILAIIALIATPIILNMINNARKSAAVDSAYGYIEAVEYNNSMNMINKDKYPLIEDGEDIDISTITNINIKGTKPDSGKISISKKRVVSASLCISGYTVEYDSKKAEAIGKCNEEKEEIIKSNDSLIGYVANKKLNDNTYETIKIKDETYTAHVYNYEGNQVWTSDKIFGDSNDVATSDKYAKNMIIVKVNGDLTIAEGVTVTAYASEEGYGGPKGLYIYVTGSLINNGTITMTARGAKAEGQNVYLYKNKDGSYEYVPKVGALGGNAKTGENGNQSGEDGSNGTNRQTGGGGSGGLMRQNSSAVLDRTSGSGSNGTSYSGGSGGASLFSNYSGITEGGFENGGKGGDALINTSYKTYIVGGGAGNPGGKGKKYDTYDELYNGSSGTGGLLIIFASNIDNKNTISSNGSQGGIKEKVSGSPLGGAGSGAGTINIFYENLFSNDGSITAQGGSCGYFYSSIKSGSGGNGTITIGTIKNNKFELKN